MTEPQIYKGFKNAAETETMFVIDSPGFDKRS